MSTDQVDRAIAAIDAVLTDDQIDDLVDWQLSRYDQRSGYDHDVNQPAPCGRYDEDTTPILCPGTYVPGPVGFGRAFKPAWLIKPAMNFWNDARWVIPDVPQQLQQIDFGDLIGSLHAATFPLSSLAPARDLTVRLIDATGRPIPLRNAKGSNIEPTDTGFTFELDLPPYGLRAAVRDRGPGGRIILEGPGGQRERISGTVTAIALNDDGTRFEIDVASEHHHLPSVYTEPEETR